MARTRLIRPEFFTDEDLATLPPLTRLLFIGLWTLADREGRVEDRPARIKMQLFPVDDIDVDDALDALCGIGVLTRYEVEDDLSREKVVPRRVMVIHNFKRFQKCHPKESASVLPAMPCKGDTSPRNLPASKTVSISTSTSTSEGLRPYGSMEPRRARPVPCGSCAGRGTVQTGWDSGKPCPDCQGSGRVTS